MSVTSKMQSIGAGYQALKLASKLMPTVQKIVKSKGKERYSEALSSETSMSSFASEIYSELPSNLTALIEKDRFVNLILDTSRKAMKKKKNQKILKKEMAKENIR